MNIKKAIEQLSEKSAKYIGNHYDLGIDNSRLRGRVTHETWTTVSVITELAEPNHTYLGEVIWKLAHKLLLLNKSPI